MKQSFAWVIALLGVIVIGCGGGGGGGTPNPTDGSSAGEYTDLRIGAVASGNVFIDPTNLEQGESYNLNVYGKNENGQVVEVPSSNWNTTAPPTVATVSADGQVSGVSATTTTYQVSASATGSTVTSNLKVLPAQARVTGRVILPQGTSGTTFAGVQVLFYTEGGTQVGQALTGHNGTFRASVPTSATRFTLGISEGSSYYRQFAVGDEVYLSSEPTCRAPLAALTNGQTQNVGDIELYLRASGPPPPPTGCVD